VNEEATYPSLVTLVCRGLAITQAVKDVNKKLLKACSERNDDLKENGMSEGSGTIEGSE